MKKTLFFLNLITAILFCSGCATTQDGLFYAAPALLPETTREMKTPGYWITRHAEPDKVILDDKGIEDLNKRIHERNLIKDIFDEKKLLSADELNEGLNSSVNDFAKAGYYLLDGKKSSDEFFNALGKKIGVVDAVDPRYGLIVQYADQRLLPTEIALNAKRFDIDFDELQNSALDAGTAVVILHQTTDGQWFFVQTALSDGWVRSESIAIGEKKTIEEFIRDPQFVVVTSAKADVYKDQSMTMHYDYLRMGVRLPVRESPDQDVVFVKFPLRDDDGRVAFYIYYLKKSDIHQGYLPFTPRQIIEQAFRVLNAPYGWGGMYGEQDCSRFMQEIFATVGVTLPRNSSAQAKAGFGPVSFPSGMDLHVKKQLIKDHALGGASMLPMKGHIMLYLGTVNHNSYAIHAPWAYREDDKGRDRIRVINRVAVTSLNLGEGSQKGSLLQRLTGIVNFSE